MNNPVIITAIITAVTSSSVIGFIQFLINRHDEKKKKPDEQMEQFQKEMNEQLNLIKAVLLGQGHDRLVHVCQKYIDEGSITVEDFNDLKEYLYEPYRNIGGNGTGEEYFNLVRDLPRRKDK